MFAKFKLRTQMLLGYATPAAIYLGLALLAAGTANQIFTTFQDVERVQNVILETSNISLGAEQMVRGLRGYLIARTDSFETEYETGFEIANKGAKAVEPFIRSEDQKKRLNRMIELINDYYASSNEMVQLVKQNKPANAIALFNQGKGTQFVQEFVRLNQEFRLAEQAILKEETVSTKGSLTALIWVLLLGSLVLIGLALLTAWFISSGIAQTINQAISAIASSSTEIAAIVEQQERMATQQAASVNETTTTMDELGASSRATSQQIETAVVQAKEALNLAGGGTKAVEQTLEAMSILKTKVEAMQGQIMQLSDQTDQIGNISTLVSDLANQTNMLALNAAVEAVRAGEHGKGFAVVAAEIRKLADQSKRSAEKINLLVADIQRAINSTVMVTDEGTKTVETGVVIAEETAQAFAGVANAINSVVLSSQQISLNAKQQAIAIEQVVDAMNALNQAANQTANGISQTKVGTRNLSEAALDLQAVI